MFSKNSNNVGIYLHYNYVSTKSKIDGYIEINFKKTNIG